MNVREIVEQWLKEHGYDGLYNSECDSCACLLDNLAECDQIDNGCSAGYKVPCDGTLPNCPCSFHVTPKKPATDGVVKADGPVEPEEEA